MSDTLTIRARIPLRKNEAGHFAGAGKFHEWPIEVFVERGADGTPVLYIGDRQPYGPMFLVDGFGEGYVETIERPMTRKARR